MSKNIKFSTLRNFFLLFVWTSTISVGTYIVGQGKYFKTKYPFHRKLDNYTERLNYLYMQARRKKDWSEFFNPELVNFNFFIESAWHNINKRVINLADFTYDYYKEKRLPGGYIEILNNELAIGSNGKGEFFKISLENYSISKVKSNLINVYEDQIYKGKEELVNFESFGIRDIFFDKKENSLYSSIMLDLTKDGCYGMGIFKAKVNGDINFKSLKELKFKEFFKMKKCRRIYGGGRSGGRIKKLNNNLIFTVGTLQKLDNESVKEAQLKNNAFGKVISINNDGKFKTLSLGHRNPQGLLIMDEKIVITEHGPQGGDEINVINPNIEEANHYGWPFYSYGYGYDYADKYRSPHKGKFIKPLYYFSPAIAPSEIIFYEGNEFPKWRNKFIVSTLKNKSLYIMDYDKSQNRILSSERINIGSRIRDLLVLDDGKLMLITDDQKLLIVSSVERGKRTFSNIKIPLKNEKSSNN